MASTKERHESIVSTMSGLVNVDPTKIVVLIGKDGKPLNPRHDLQLDDLKQFIRDNGTASLPPIDVQLQAEGMVLVHGHRRLQATLDLIGENEPIKSIPAIIIPAGKTLDNGMIVLKNLTQNQGIPLSEMEQAEGISKLVGYGWKQNVIAKEMGKTPARISQILNVLKTTDKVQEARESGDITSQQLLNIAKATKDVTDPVLKQELQEKELQKAIAEKEQRSVKQGTGSQGTKRGRPSLKRVTTTPKASTTTPVVKSGISENVQNGQAQALHESINALMAKWSMQDVISSLLLWDKNAGKSTYNTMLKFCLDSIKKHDTPMVASKKQPVTPLVTNGEAVSTNGQKYVVNGVEKTRKEILEAPLPDPMPANTDTVPAEEMETIAVLEKVNATLTLSKDGKTAVLRNTGKKGSPSKHIVVRMPNLKNKKDKEIVLTDSKGISNSYMVEKNISPTEYAVSYDVITK